MTSRQSYRVRAAATSFALAVAAGLSSACGASDAREDTAKASESESTTPSAAILDTNALKAALPDQFSVFPGVAEPRMRKAWEASDTEICLSEQWPSEWCAKAVAVGLSAFTNMEDRELAIQMISFPDVKTAAAAFEGEGTLDEVGKNPPGDEIDGFEIEDPDGGTAPTGRGINVRKGAVVAKIQYTWAKGASIKPGALMSLAKMVVKRIEQAQRGENPTASVR